MVIEIATLIREEFDGQRTLSAQFILLGADTVQVCTGVMKMGYKMVKPMIEGLIAFMETHGFETLDDFKGKALPYFTTHADLVERQAQAQAKKRAAVAAKQEAKEAVKHAEREGITIDEKWDRDDFVQQSDELVSG